MKKVFMACYGGGHVNMILPLHRLLLQDALVEPVVIALSIAGPPYRDSGLAYRSLLDYSDVIMDEDAFEFGKQLADRWHVESSGITWDESVVYLGSSMRDLVQEHGRERAEALLEQKQRAAFLPVQTMNTIVKYEAPDVVVTTNSPRMERAASIAGITMKIPTLNLHDDLGFHARDYLLNGDVIAVMSEITKDNLVAQGHPSDPIRVLGHPGFDPVQTELDTWNRDEIVERLQLPGQGPYLLLGTSQPGNRGETSDMLPVVADAVAQMGNYHLIVKPHPGEDAEAYRSFAAERNDVTVVTGVGIRELIFVSELLISFKSTIVIEAFLMNKPFVSLNLTGRPSPVPYVDWNLGVEASNQTDLVRAVHRVGQDEDFRAKFSSARERYFGNSVDGGATRRIVDLIYEIGGLTAPTVGA